MFDTINSLKPYFFSLREYKPDKENPAVSLDIRIPLNWKLIDIKDPVTYKLTDQNTSVKLISLLSLPTKEGYDAVFTTAKRIIRFNLEEEEKQRLFDQKLEELKTVFLNTPLDKLKGISFDKFLEKDGLRDQSRDREVELGNSTGESED